MSIVLGRSDAGIILANNDKLIMLRYCGC